ncbi:O-antigen ligase family protein [Spartinivicinus ruber]|uniref:O-antigen ligase family protein n=1 Tax=Spartinivicinus ruber TaxID=2683272 RepID=UPI0013D70D3C|nr:O-antigen ligase family protein [Spartinivicinus ruber]
MGFSKLTRSAVDPLKGGQWLVYCLYFFVASYAVFATSKTVNNIFYIFLLAPAVFIFPLKIYKSLIKTKDCFLYVVAVMTLFFAVSGLWGDDVSYKYLKYVLYIVGFILLVNFLIVEEYLDPQQLIKVCVWVTFLYLVYAFIDTYLVQNKGFPAGRINPLPSRIDNPIYTSIWLVSVFFCYLGYGIAEKNGGLKWQHLCLLLVLVFFLYLIRSRSGFVVLFCGAGLIALSVIINRNSKKQLWQFGAVALAIIVFFVVGYSFGLFDSMIARADSYRFQVWQQVLKEYSECGYLLGCGYGYDIISSVDGGGVPIAHPHNIFIAHLLYSGVVGLILLVAVTLIALYRACKIWSPWGVYLVLACIGLLFDGDKILTSPSEVWLLYILPLSVICGEYNKELLNKKLVDIN